uniref:Putative immunodominant protein n=1 Tax=Candidatus Phytoplasma pruni -related phytoplasma TaxID=2213004 RepID=A0A3S9VMS5_9MOLU|nr:putative immunodominant protein [Candidatus Phytoplasma pruni -related phytoplasma]
MVAMDKHNKQSYLKTKNGKIVLGVVSAVVVLLTAVGVWFLMKNSPSKAVKNLESNLVSKWDTVYTEPISKAKQENSADKKAAALKKVVKTLRTYYKDMEYLTNEEKNKKPEDATKKTAYEAAQAAVKTVKAALDAADNVTGKDDAAVTSLSDALEKVTKDICQTVVTQSKTAYGL